MRNANLLPVLAVLAGCATAPAVPSSPVAPGGPSAAAAPPAAPPARRSGVDLAGMDRSVAAGDDFYLHANGAWQARAVIPPERSFTGPILDVVERVAERTRAIDEEAARSGAPAGSPQQQIGDYYASVMDEERIEALGLAPIAPTLDRIAAVADRRALAAELGGTVRADVDLLNATDMKTGNVLGLWVEQDLNDPTRNAAYLVQGGLGLPDRSYYLDEGADFATIRKQYQAHLAAMFRLAGVAAPEAEARAGRVVAFEIRIARTHATRTDSGDVQKGNNPWTRAELETRAPGMDWGVFLRAAGLDRQPGFIVWQPSAVVGLAALVQSEPLSTWKEWLAVRALEHAAPLLPRAFAEEHFRFHGTVLQGTPRMLVRWKRAVAATDAALGEAVGRIYVTRHFPEGARRELQEMVARIVAAFDRRIEALDWMAPSTKAKARAKLAGLKVGIAHPDSWRSFEGLVVVRGEALANRQRVEAFDLRQELDKLERPPDRSEWAMLPQTVNAVNLPVRNALNFPAGYLEPPFYDRDASPAVKYATIGATIGHEISHSFDDQGSLFDAAGRLATWWTPEDLRHFEAAGARLVAQYDAYRPFPDLAVSGKLTLGENIADLAGLAAAHDAWRETLGGKPAPVLDGLDGEQQFFLGNGQSWRILEREEALRESLLTDGHAPGRYRALTVRNLDAWYPAFDIRPGQALYLSPESRVRVW